VTAARIVWGGAWLLACCVVYGTGYAHGYVEGVQGLVRTWGLL